MSDLQQHRSLDSVFTCFSPSYSSPYHLFSSTVALLVSFAFQLCCSAPNCQLSPTTITTILVQYKSLSASRLAILQLITFFIYNFYHYQRDDSTITRYRQSVATSNYPSTDFFVMDYFYFDYYHFIKKWITSIPETEIDYLQITISPSLSLS